MKTTDRALWIVLIGLVIAIILGVVSNSKSSSENDSWKTTVGIPYDVVKSGWETAKGMVEKNNPNLRTIYPIGWDTPEFHVARIRDCATPEVTCYRFDSQVHGINIDQIANSRAGCTAPSNGTDIRGSVLAPSRPSTNRPFVAFSFSEENVEDRGAILCNTATRFQARVQVGVWLTDLKEGPK
jgi:hypothetical protein